MAACTTPITGDTQLKHQDVIAAAQTQFKYVSGELEPEEPYNHYISRPVQNARKSILFAVLKKELGEEYAQTWANQGSLEALSPIKIISVSEINTSYSKKAHWASFVYTTVDIKLSNGKTKRVKYKTTVALASSVQSDTPIVSLSSFDLIGVKNI
jgi:hypothetical protein